jgi:hypothetical protein
VQTAKLQHAVQNGTQECAGLLSCSANTKSTSISLITGFMEFPLTDSPGDTGSSADHDCELA